MQSSLGVCYLTGNFVSVQNGTVKISQPGGFSAEVPLTQPSEADQQFVASQTTQQNLIAAEQAEADKLWAEHGKNV